MSNYPRLTLHSPVLSRQNFESPAEYARVRAQQIAQIRAMNRARRLNTRSHEVEPLPIESEPDSSDTSDDDRGDDESNSHSSASDHEDTSKEKKKKSTSKDKKVKKSKKQNADASAAMSYLANLLAGAVPKAKPSQPSPVDILDATLPPPPPPLSSVPATVGAVPSASEIASQVVLLLQQQEKGTDNKKVGKSGSKLAYKRLDQVYDRKIHNFKLRETVKGDDERDEWDQYIFTVRRQFDVSSRYVATVVDVRSKILIECLKQVMDQVKGVNLVTEKPALKPNMLFLYLEELREMYELYKVTSTTSKDKKEKKKAKTAAEQLKVLVAYLDEDFAETKKALYPMLEAGIITFDYLWALFKPNTILYSSTYDDEEIPRAFKAVYSQESRNFMKGTWYDVEGRYLEYNGKSFGMATMHGEIPSFSGARKISSLPCYPLRYHRAPEEAKAILVERGKKFVALQGMNYKTYSGMSYVKKEEKVLKVDVNGRIMVDSRTFRKVNPNYPLSVVRSIQDDVEDINSLASATFSNGNATISSEDTHQSTPPSEDFEKQKQFRIVKDDKGQLNITEIGSDEAELASKTDKLSKIFSEEQLLLASPVVPGFSFTEKLWLEFAVSNVGEISWNTDAFESLILPDNQKSIVKAMVSSHAFHPSRSIDDIIAGKGKGLVAVLHGGPGLGKTLTVESIADLLQRPLYVVSAGDLGTSSERLERELQTILDIAHSWGAVLLLDEADVFLEKRSTHDIHRNALVSIFLRLLEYFQGILFLTTNRVEVFDDAFVSRIHLSLRYGDLSTKAKKAVWQTFINKVKEIEGMRIEDITDKDLDDLSRRALNGRQIKNIVRAAQAVAIHEDVPLSMKHIRTVLDVAQSFERDLKGGTGYEDAMRGYT